MSSSSWSALISVSGTYWPPKAPDLQHLHHRTARLEAGLLRAVQLQQVEVDELGDLPHLVRRLVDKHADDLRADQQLLDDRPRLLRRDSAVGVAEMKPDQVGPRLDGHIRRLEIADAADLDPDHVTSALIAAAGSAERMSSSPTRIASAPASRIRRASAGVWMPLSATRTTFFGISPRSRSVRPRSTLKS